MFVYTVLASEMQMQGQGRTQHRRQQKSTVLWYSFFFDAPLRALKQPKLSQGLEDCLLSVTFSWGAEILCAGLGGGWFGDNIHPWDSGWNLADKAFRANIRLPGNSVRVETKIVVFVFSRKSALRKYGEITKKTKILVNMFAKITNEKICENICFTECFLRKYV